MRRFGAVVAGVSLLASGCVTTPSFDRISGVKPKTVVDVIECELIQARNNDEKRIAALQERIRRGAIKAGTRFPRLKEWTAVVELTLQVDEELTLTPAFTHTDVVSQSLTRAFDWGVKVDTQASRIYNETVTFELGRLPEQCPKQPSGRWSINGDLGLQEIVEMAFGSIDLDDPATLGSPPREQLGEQHGESARKETKPAPQPNAMTLEDIGQRRLSGGRRQGQGKGGKSEAAFGTTIEFQVVSGLSSAGPTWSLKYFRGPGKLFSAQRTDTHRLTISFGLSAGEAVTNNNKLNVQTLTGAIKSLPR
jgi:hypothetical protein